MGFQTVEAGINIDGTWVDAIDVGDGVRQSEEIQITHGRQNWAGQVDPARAVFALDNRDGRWSPDNPTGPYFGNYKLNIPTRIGVATGDRFLRTTGDSSDVASTPDIAGTGGGSPTAPAFVDVTTSTETANTTTHGVDLPATVNATDRLLLVVSAGQDSLAPKDQGGGATDLDDWTLVISSNLYTPWHKWLVYEIEVEDATQAAALAGSTVEFSTAGAVKSTGQVIRTSGARSGGEGFAWDAQDPSSSTFSSSVDPPSLTTSWGADEHRWYAFAIYGSGTDTVSTYPSSYTSIADSGAGSGTNLPIASAHLTTSAATEDPGAFTLTGDENWQAFTFVYRANEDTSSDGVLDISGDIDLRVEFQLEQDLVELTEGGIRARLAQKSSGANGIGWNIYQASGDVVASFVWYDQSGGLNFVTTEGTGAVLPRSFMHDRSALRVTLDVDNGASGYDATWYTSDGIGGTWTQLGATIVGGSTTNIRTNDAELRVGGSATSSPATSPRIVFPGKIYAFEMYDGINGTAVANPDFSAEATDTTSFTDAAGRVWAIGSGGRISNVRWRFHGEMSSLPLRSSKKGNDIWSPVEVQGIFRRLRQGNRRLDSALNRAIIRDAASLVQYWPMEETGDTVSAFGASVGNNPMTITGGYPSAASSSEFLSSAAIATPGDTVWTAIVDSYATSNAWQVRWLQFVPEGYTGTDIEYLRVSTTDMEWRMRYRDTSGGQISVTAYRGGSNVYTSGWYNFDATGKAARYDLRVIQNGSSCDLIITAQEEDAPVSGGVVLSSVVAGSSGQVTRIQINTNSNIDDWAIGHVTLQSASTSTAELAEALRSHSGETAGRRIERICREEGIASRIEGDPDQTEVMGAQRPGSLMDLLQECADTDLGILYEARESLAVAYRTRTSMLNQTAAVTIDADLGELADPLELDRDDQGVANDVTVENWNGTIGRAVLDDGSPMSVSPPPVGIGRYDSKFDVNGSNSRLTALAQSRLDLSTVDEPRVSKIAINLHKDAVSGNVALHASILDHSLGDVITVENYAPLIIGSGNDINQIMQGYTETIGWFTHRLEYNTTPASPWSTVAGPPAAHTVTFREGNDLAYSGSPQHVLQALGYTGSTPITRSQLDTILDGWVAGTGGTTRNVTSSGSWTTAVNNAEPGDLIRVTAGFDALIDVRGDRYGISGENLTTSPSGGLPGLPIIVTCADGVYVDDNNVSSNAGVLDLTNCEHVWAVGFNVRDGQFGIRCQNWGGSAGFPAYVAYCDIDNIGDAGLVGEGWFQAIASSGGTPPAGAGNEWGFSNFGVFESNTITDPGRRVGGNPGEGIYLGHGGSPGWIAYVKDFWVRGNVVTGWTSDAIDLKPGCHRVYITDNELHTGHAVNGSPMHLLYVASTIDTRAASAALFDADPEIWVEGNRVYDNDITSANASSVHIMGYVGLSGIRIANNVFWAHPTTATHATWRFRNEKGTNDTEALAEFRADPTWIINNTCWNDDIVDEGGYGAGATAWPASVTSTWDFRNNIREDSGAGTTHGDVEANSADFIATVPAIGAAGNAEWETYGNGSAFDLATDSALVGTGASITDITFEIEEDISQRPIDKAAPNPGAFQPFPT